jgi:hypothetical protein
MVLAGRAAVTGQLGGPVGAVEGEVEVRDHAGQGVAGQDVAWLPPLRTQTTVSAACSNRVILSPSLAGVKIFWKEFIFSSMAVLMVSSRLLYRLA